MSYSYREVDMANREEFTHIIDHLLELVDYYNREHTDELRSQIDETVEQLHSMSTGMALDSKILF